MCLSVLVHADCLLPFLANVGLLDILTRTHTHTRTHARTHALSMSHTHLHHTRTTDGPAVQRIYHMQGHLTLYRAFIVSVLKQII